MNIQDLPPYQQGQYYNLGTDRVKAQAGLDYINKFCPLLNMERWAERLTYCLDGNYRVERIPTCRLIEAIGSGAFTQADLVLFVETYVVSIDEYSDSWFPPPKEEV